MYNWRKMTKEQQNEVLELRKNKSLAWHSPPNGYIKSWYHISSACFEHKHIIGVSSKRMIEFEIKLREKLSPVSESIIAWCILPNHYHILIQAMNISECKNEIGKLHGSTSFLWNKEESKQGRKCWHNSLIKKIESESYLYATINYIHNNPVKHKYVKKWQDWSCSSASSYLDDVGNEYAKKMWLKHPVYDMGENWDD